MDITMEQLRLWILNMFLFFSIGFSGAFTKDLYDTMVGKNKKIQISRVFVGALFSSFIIMGISQPLIRKFNIQFNTIILINYIIGVIGFELFGVLSTLRGLNKGLKKAIEVKRAISDLSSQTSDITDLAEEPVVNDIEDTK